MIGEGETRRCNNELQIAHNTSDNSKTRAQSSYTN